MWFKMKITLKQLFDCQKKRWKYFVCFSEMLVNLFRLLFHKHLKVFIYGLSYRSFEINDSNFEKSEIFNIK